MQETKKINLMIRQGYAHRTDKGIRLERNG